MVDTLLQSLRGHVLDESQSLAGLLRKCLVLGAETGSDALRDWARRELNGYGDEDVLPDYRNVGRVPISIDSVSGRWHSTQQALSYLQIPQGVRKFIPEELLLRQPVDELEAWVVKDETITMSSGMMPAAAQMWSQQLGPFQEVLRMYWALSPALVAGILGRVRNTLVDFVAELTSDVPLTELPTRATVDAAFAAKVMHMGDTYNTHIAGPSGPVAVGKRAKAEQEGVSLNDVILVLGKVQAYADAVEDESARRELLDAVDDLKEAASRDQLDADEVKAKGERLKALGAKVGVGALAAATSGAAEAAMNLAVSGVFG
ncbi:hypothetical protein ACFQU3_00080 [Terrabacter sp. GCM10028922]|uniref:AbiTii domain-containing protein n=1 Tax=Terrabacter sp. GCM10028922 TaxID=3273428 RepID=UPI00361D5E1C